MQHWKPSLIVFLISTLITYAVFHVIMPHLPTTMLSEHGDGIKNIYTFFYYIQYDAGLHFSGMNYPFDEHVIFTDNMPIISAIFKQLNAWFPWFQSYNVFAFNFILLSSFPIASVVLFKIFRIFISNNYWAIFGALIITFSAPMYMRMNGHFGMAIIYYLPLIIYLLMRWHYDRKYIYLITLTAVIGFFNFVHLYNLALALLLVGAYVLVYWIMYRKTGLRNLLLACIGPILSVMIPMIITQVFLKITDSITDRNGHPWGVFGGGTEGKDIFLSNFAPLGHVFQFIFGKTPAYGGEGYIYMGLIAILAILTCVVIGILRLVYRNSSNSSIYHLPYTSYHIWLWVAGFCLLIGMGFPIQSGMYFLTDYIASLRQFRTVGRFSWIFYTLVQVYVFLFLYHTFYWAKAKNFAKKYIQIVASVVVIILSVQSTGIFFFYKYLSTQHQYGIHDEFMGKDDAYDFNAFLQRHHKTASQYQSALFLPLYHVGSEKVWIHEFPKILFNSMAMSMQTGIPLTNVMMSRTSLNQTFQNITLEDGPLADWSVLKKYKDQAFLIIIDTAATDNNTYQWYKKHTNLIGHWLQYAVYEAHPQQLLTAQHKYVQDILQGVATSTDSIGVWMGDHFISKYAYQSFDNFPDKGIHNQAYFHTEKLDRDTVAKFAVSDFRTEDTLYTFSAWTKVSPTDYSSTVIVIEQMDAEGNRLEETVLHGSKSTYVIDFWMMNTINFTLKEATSTVLISVLNDDKKINKYEGIDEIVIYPAKGIFYNKENGQYWINNRPMNKVLD